MEAGGKMAVSPSATEMLLPFPSHDVELASSWVKQREDLNTAFLKSLEPDRLLHNFRVNAGLPSVAKPLEGWESPGVGLRGHFVGHYLSAVSALVERYEDAGLARNLEKVVEGMYACQQAHGNGYLSAFPETDIEVLETRFTGVWAPYYTLHKIMQGLLDVYLRTGNEKAYAMVEGLAGYVDRRMSKLDPATVARMMYTADANPQNEMGGMNEVLYQLYCVSGKPRGMLQEVRCELLEYAHAFPCVCQRHKQRSAPERHDRDFVDGRALGRTLPSVQYFDQRHCGELRDP